MRLGSLPGRFLDDLAAAVGLAAVAHLVAESGGHNLPVLPVPLAGLVHATLVVLLLPPTPGADAPTAPADEDNRSGGSADNLQPIWNNGSLGKLLK